MMQSTGLSHTTTFATFSMAHLPDVTKEEFERAMLQDVLPVTDYPLNRSDNVIGQEFREGAGDVAGVYQWVIIWNGVGNTARIVDGCETIYANVKDNVERVGTRTGFDLAKLRARWGE